MISINYKNIRDYKEFPLLKAGFLLKFNTYIIFLIIGVTIFLYLGQVF